jgi:hypothetical protein
VAEPSGDDEEHSLPDEWDLAVVATKADVFFTKYELLLESQSSVDRELLEDERKADKVINTFGIKLGAKTVVVDIVGDFREFGTVYYSEHAPANILSFASQANAGADIEYDKVLDRFTLSPADSSNTYISGPSSQRRRSEGKVYVCNLSEMTDDS